MTVRPGVTACLACLLAGERDGAGMEETCDTVGVLGPIVNLVASMEVAEALKLLSGQRGGAEWSAGFLRCVDVDDFSRCAWRAMRIVRFACAA